MSNDDHDQAAVAARYGVVVPDDLAVAHQLVRRGRLCVRRGHSDDEAARAIARALRVWGPDHPHGALVLEALRPRSRAERRAGRRSYDLRPSACCSKSAAPPLPTACVSGPAASAPWRPRPSKERWPENLSVRRRRGAGGLERPADARR